MFNLVPFTENDYPRLAAIVAADATARRWIEFYADGARWAAQTSRTRYALDVREGEHSIGFIDVETDSDGVEAAFTFYVAPEYRGQGNGPRVIEGLKWWLGGNSRVRVLFAYVDEANRASARSLEAANFCYETKYRGMLTYVTRVAAV